MARKFWPNEDALGKRFWQGSRGANSPLFQIVGIVGDVKQMGLDVPAKEEMYFPYWQAQGNYMVPTTVVVAPPAIRRASPARSVKPFGPLTPVFPFPTS